MCIYLSLEAFSSRTASLKEVPRRVRARQRMLVVLPVPGGPWGTRVAVQRGLIRGRGLPL